MLVNCTIVQNNIALKLGQYQGAEYSSIHPVLAMTAKENILFKKSKILK